MYVTDIFRNGMCVNDSSFKQLAAGSRAAGGTSRVARMEAGMERGMLTFAYPATTILLRAAKWA
jgi:hypothetical protein